MSAYLQLVKKYYEELPTACHDDPNIVFKNKNR
jgi:hypothetical protein